MSDDLEVSIIMPCLNEAETVGTCVEKARGWLARAQVRGEIVIGDNGSTDGSQAIARAKGARVVDVPVRGYGAACYHAAAAAQGKYVIMGDSDDSYDFSELSAFVERLRQGCDLVMGNRFQGGILPGAMPWKNRYLGNPVLSGIGRILFGCPCRDFHCGLRGFSKEAFQKLQLQTAGMEYASEMVIKATLAGLKIAEVPIKLHPAGRQRAPHLRPWRDGWRHLRFMLLFSPRWLFLLPGFVAMVIGFVLGAVLWVGPLRVGPMVFDIHTLFYCAVLFQIGFQAALFGVMARIYGTEVGLLPRSAQYEDVFRHFSLERGLILGVLLLLLGAGGSGQALWQWQQVAFGQLNPAAMFRQVLPSAVALIVGFEVVLFSLFLSVLGLRFRRR